MKQWHQSLTIKGAIIALLATTLRYFGIEAVSQDLVALVDAVFTLAALVGTIMSILGRLRASERIGGKL